MTLSLLRSATRNCVAALSNYSNERLKKDDFIIRPNLLAGPANNAVYLRNNDWSEI